MLGMIPLSLALPGFPRWRALRAKRWIDARLRTHIERARRDPEATGLLAGMVAGRDEQGRYLGNTGGVNMFDTFNSIWLSFLEQNRIERQEYENMTLPQYYNTVEEFSEPLIDHDDSVYQAGLRLEHIDTRIVECPFAQSFKQHGDAERFATEYIPTIRTWNESIYFNALSSERPLEQRRQIIEDYYATYRDMVRDNPDGHGMDYVHAYMVIAKTG